YCPGCQVTALPAGSCRNTWLTCWLSSLMRSTWQALVTTGSCPGAVMLGTFISQSVIAWATQYNTRAAFCSLAWVITPVLLWRTLPASSSPMQRSQLPLRQALGKPNPAVWPAARMLVVVGLRNCPQPHTVML